MNKDLIYALTLENAIKFSGKASQGAVMGMLLAMNPDAKNHIKEVSKIIIDVLKDVNSMSLEKQKEKFSKLSNIIHHEEKKERIGLPELNNTESGVVVRFAPYPSGPLHIGNAKQLVLNDEYAKMYQGKFILVFDDTIGSEEKNISEDAYSLIKEGVEWIGAKIDETYYKSDRLEIYYKYAQEMIKENKAYVCKCSSIDLRSNRENSLECIHRNQSIDENLKLWNDMINKKLKVGQAILRIKTSMTNPNPAFRDRVLFRITDRKHPRTKLKYTVWPLLEFSWAIDDHLFGMTHIIRGKDLMIESDMEKFIWNIFGWKHPELIHTGMAQIEGIKLSKSKSKQEVVSGKYSGWDDPRTWSLQSLKRRGFRKEAIRKFLLKSGLSRNDVHVPIEDLYSENRDIIDKDSNRYFFVQNPKLIIIEGFKGKKVQLDLHPDNPEKGKRLFKVTNKFYINKSDFDSLKDDNIYRLMDCVNFTKSKDKFIFHSEDYESFKGKGTKIMHWLPKEEVIKSNVVMEDASIIQGLVEKNASNMKIDEVCQFERTFFAKLDKKSKNNYIFYFTHK